MTKEIPLTRGLVALVDDEDHERVMAAGKWHSLVDGNTSYAARRVRRDDGGRTSIRLHNFLTGWPLVDHRNGNGLDNRRENLRPATPEQNARNRRKVRAGKYKGVSWRATRLPWQAGIKARGVSYNLGGYATEEEAARAYDAAALELHGAFARLNFPDEDPGPMRPRRMAYAARTHCPQGHEYTPENTRRDGKSRHCRACHRERGRARYAAMKARRTEMSA